ncbi:MAG: restriction endonuclease subunit S [Bacillota bacterium]|nr:restriction endonuclease subunit S [Bacillota bacterium]
MTPEVRDRIEQIRRGNVPEGYKKVGSDIIPSDWSKSPFSQLGIISSGLVNPKEQPYFEMQHIGPDNIEKDTGRILETQSAAELGLISGKFYFDSDSIVYSKIRPNLNKVCAPHFEGICSADCYSIKPTDKIDKAYLLNLMLGYSFYKRAVECSMRTGMPKINQDDLNTIAMCYPKSIDEQKKIAKILTTQDKVIESKEKLLAEKQRQKKYLMQQLLTGKRRLPGFNEEWRFIRARTIFENITDKKHDGTLEVLSVTQDRGIIPRSQVDIDIKYTNKSLSGYKKVAKGNFVISLRSFQGGIEYSEYEGIVSPAYIVLSASYPIDNGYYKQFFKSPDCISRLSVAVYGVRDGKQISYEDFGRIKIPYPPLNEQKTIAKVLTTADHEIDLLQQDLEQEKQKKKALMQLLLTGIVKV